MTIIDSQVHAYDANTPKRPWKTVPELAPPTSPATKWWRRWTRSASTAQFSFRRFPCTSTTPATRWKCSAPIRTLRPRQADRPGQSGAGRRHRRLEENAGRGWHTSHHDDEGAGVGVTTTIIRASIASCAKRSGRILPVQHAVLGQPGRGHRADRPPSRHAIHHRPPGASCSRARRPPRRRPGPTCRKYWTSPGARMR